MDEQESEVVFKGPCSKCGSSDANAMYTDGHSHCFSCSHHTAAPTSHTHQEPVKPTGKAKALLDGGEIKELRVRKISAETCAKFNYRYNEFKGKRVQVAPYYDEEGRMVAQKVRFPDKDFVMLGDPKKALLFGQHLWSPGGKMVIVTEGEIDCLTMSQLQGNKWATVSVPSGAAGAKKALSKQLDFLNSFEKVVLCFDQDEAGQAAAEECAPLFTPGKCVVVRLPLKDPNEMLVAGQGEALMRAAWNAQPYRPASVLTVADIYEDALKPIEMGMDWPWPTLTDATFGIQRGRVYTYGAGTGVGKTDVFTQVAAHTRTVLNKPVGLIYLEQAPTETLNRLAGKVYGKPFHVPDGSWTDPERKHALTQLRDMDGIYFRNAWGLDDWESIAKWIRWLVVSEGVKDIFLDHLTALATGRDESEKEALESIMAEAGSLTKELDFTLHLVSHLTTPEGKPHEEGGRVTIRHFKGSRAIGYWSHVMFGLERSQQDPDPERRNVTTFRILKDRLSGRGTGVTFGLRYDQATGILHECLIPEPEQKTGSAYGFKPQQPGGSPPTEADEF